MKRNYAPLIALAGLLVICLLGSTHFRNPVNLMNITRQVSYSGIIALGMTLVIAAGGIDLSAGSLVAFCGVFALAAAKLCPTLPAAWQLLIMLAVALLAGLAGGALNGALINWGGIPPFIVTLGTLSIFRSLAVFKADAGLIIVDNEWLDRICGGWTPVATLLAITLLLAFILRHTPLGWRICAVGANERTAHYAAISVCRIRFVTYALIGTLSGISAFLLAGRLSSISSTGAGTAYELDAIAAVIIGGTPMTGGKASIWGTLAGVFILGIIANILDLWSISANLQGSVKGAVIILAVLFQFQKKGALGAA